MRKAKTVAAVPQESELLDEQIARKAYELYEQRGGAHGHDLDDWLAAERLMREKTAAASPPVKAKSKVVPMKRKKA
jgi:hypothetical protein